MFWEMLCCYVRVETRKTPDGVLAFGMLKLQTKLQCLTAAQECIHCWLD